MNKLREKLLDWKRRLSDRRMYSVIIVIIAIIAIWGIYQHKRMADLRQELDNQYNRAFFEMTGYVDNVRVLLLKAMLASTPEMTAHTMQEAWHQANMAQTNLGQLPVSQHILASTSKFLSQVGDLAFSLNNKNMAGQKLTEEQYNTIKELHKFATKLDKNLKDLQNSLNQGRLRWNELANKGTKLFRKTSKHMALKMFENMDKTFQKYPTLIYDGPFSDHLTKIKPKGLTGQKLTMEQAREKLKKFMGTDRVSEIVFSGESKSDTIETYSFTVRFKDKAKGQTATADVSKIGGHVVWMLYNRNVAAEGLNVEQAKQKGLEFLKSRGYKNMKDTYYLKEDGVATINYAYTQNGVVIYPDLIKVKVALDNGEIVGFESKGYLMSHRIRQIPTPKITEEEARARVTKKTEILSLNLAVIPTNFGTEIFVYELKGKMNKQDFLVYVNAQTGKEENILIIINSENGILTL